MINNNIDWYDLFIKLRIIEIWIQWKADIDNLNLINKLQRYFCVEIFVYFVESIFSYILYCINIYTIRFLED